MEERDVSGRAMEAKVGPQNYQHLPKDAV